MPSPQPTLITYEQLVFQIDHVALSSFQVQLARDSVQMALKVALNVSAASVGAPVATAGPPVPAPSPMLRRLAGSTSASPTAAPLPAVIITTTITTTNINTGSESQGVVSDTNSAVLLATFQRNTALFLSTFLASVTTFDSSPANRLQFSSASIPLRSIYVVSLVPTLAPVRVPVVTSAPTATAAWSAVEGAAQRHKLSIIVGASLGGVLIFLMLCLGCIARPYIKLWCSQGCSWCCGEKKAADGSKDGKKGAETAAKPGCCSRLAACLCCLCRCCCKKKAPPLASRAAEMEEEEDDDDEDEEEDEEEEEDDEENPEGTGVDMTNIYSKKDAAASAPFTTPTSAAAFAKAAASASSSKSSVRSSLGGALGKTSSNPLSTAPVSPTRRGSTK